MLDLFPPVDMVPPSSFADTHPPDFGDHFPTFSDMRQHYIYMLFKYTHIVMPNAEMAAKFKANRVG